jgi:spore maturation protein CgeB
MDPARTTSVRRIVVLGAGGSRKTEDAIARAARSLGHACRLVDVVGWRRRLGPLGAVVAERLTAGFDADTVVVTRHAWKLGEARLRRLFAGRRSVFWFFDPAPHPGTLELARLVDVFYTTYFGQLDEYRRLGLTDVRFLPQGMDPDRDRPTAPEPAYACDVSFVGSGGFPHRLQILRAVAASARLQIRGPGWNDAPAGLPVAGGPVHGEEFNRVVASAAISLGAHALPEQARDAASASNRMWKILGAGGFYLGEHVQGIEQMAVGGTHCAWYKDATDVQAQVRDWLARPEDRMRIAAAGRAHALAHHTYAHRLELLLGDRSYDPTTGTGVP